MIMIHNDDNDIGDIDDAAVFCSVYQSQLEGSLQQNGHMTGHVNGHVTGSLRVSTVYRVGSLLLSEGVSQQKLFVFNF